MPGRGQRSPLPRPWRAIKRKESGERVARKGDNKAILLVDALDQRAKHGAHHRGQHLRPVLAMRHQCIGDGAKAGDVHKKTGRRK